MRYWKDFLWKSTAVWITFEMRNLTKDLSQFKNFSLNSFNVSPKILFSSLIAFISISIRWSNSSFSFIKFPTIFCNSFLSSLSSSICLCKSSVMKRRFWFSSLNWPISWWNMLLSFSRLQIRNSEFPPMQPGGKVEVVVVVPKYIISKLRIRKFK